MMKQMNKLQRDMETKQAELAAQAFSKTAGGGLITIKALGNKTITELTISDELLEDKEILQDMLILATNELMSEIEAVSEKEIGKLTGGMKIPGLF
ncbi:MAG: YbaB/EbfC family nucleoid-associated protein [Culicoidibacterales bacterium]